MLASLGLVLVVVAVVVVTAAPLGRRLPPPAQAVMVAGAAVGCALSWLCVLSVLAAPWVLGPAEVRALLGLPVAGVAVRHTVPIAVSATATVVLVATMVVLAVIGWRRWPAVRELWRLGRHRVTCTSDGVTVVRSDGAFAVAVPGWPGRVVVSSAMLEALDAGERRVLLAHERCHLRAGHYVFRWATRLAAAVFPPVHPLVAECDFALERWADEHAASAVGDRRVAARALVRAALAARSPLSGVLAFPQRAVTRRVAALAEEPPAMQWLPLAALGLLALAAALAGVSAAHHIHILVHFPRPL